jgi:hypothetical protein
MSLTTFQENLIEELKSEFTKLNPPVVQSSGRFSLETVKKDVDDTEAFKKSVWDYNKKMSIMLKESMLKQVEEFNREFFPVNLRYKHLNMFDYADDYYLKNPKTAETAFYFNDEYDYTRFYLLYSYDNVEIKTSCETIQLSKLKGLLWSRRDWLHRNDSGGKFYTTLDEFVQDSQNLQQIITSQYKKLSKVS